MTLMQQLLDKQDADVQTRILQIVKNLQLDENDPIFLLMLSISTVQVLVENAPVELKQTYEYCHQQLLKDLDKYEKAASRGVEARLAKSVEDILQKAGASKALITLKSLTIACLSSALLLGLGMLAGFGLSEKRHLEAGIDPSGKRMLTAEQANAMNWAMSAQGKYARQFMSWNDSIQNGECRAQVKELGVTLQYGTRSATDGFCFTWVVPPSQRRFN